MRGIRGLELSLARGRANPQPHSEKKTGSLYNATTELKKANTAHLYSAGHAGAGIYTRKLKNTYIYLLGWVDWRPDAN